MANFSGLVLTKAGADLQDKLAVRGTALTFTRAALGDGLWLSGLDPTSLTGLVSEKMSLPIQGLSDTGQGQHTLSLTVDNTNLAAGFMLRELGVFAMDPDLGEILYQVSSASNPDYLPPKGGATHVEMSLDLHVVTDSAESVTAVINDSLVYATKKELAAHADSFKGFALSGRHEAFTGDLDEISRNSLYAVQKGVAQHLPADMPDGVQGFVQTMVQPDGESRTQVLWSVDDPEHPGWWRRRAAGSWGTWRVLGGGGLPVGTVLWVPGTTPPPGMLAVNTGASLNRATWPELWKFAQDSGLLITEAEWQAQAAVQSSVGYFSSGDGATSFRLPRLRDYLRGADAAGGRGVGAWQGDELRAHMHGLQSNDPVSATGSGRGDVGRGTNTPSGYYTGSTGGDETRPKTINWLPCIQAASLPVDSGTVNMLELASEVASLGRTRGLPVGTVLWVPGTTPPPGMLAINDGTEIGRAIWPDLWKFAQDSGLLITEAEWQAQAAVQSSVGYFSSGDGATSFRLPRLRDYLRGADAAGGRGVGAWQGDRIKEHPVGLRTDRIANTITGPSTGNNAAIGSGALAWANNQLYGGDVGATETRPKSINWLPCIQAATVPVNAGTVDMLELANEVAGKADRAEVVLQKSYESPEQSITLAGAITLAHGLGAKPKRVEVFYKCANAVLGFPVGAEVPRCCMTTTSFGPPMVMHADSTSIYIRNTSYTLSMDNFGTGVRANVTPSDWRIIVRAYA